MPAKPPASGGREFYWDADSDGWLARVPAAPPAPRPLTASALGYLGELRSAAQVVQLRRGQAELAYESCRWLEPARTGRGDHGPDGASISPLWRVNGYRTELLLLAVHRTRREVGSVAWWYASAALATLDAVLTGQEITARQLEQLTSWQPGREHKALADALPWAACFRPPLPDATDLRTGDEDLDAAMDQALAPLRQAYAAAQLLEDRDQDDDEGDSAEDPVAVQKASVLAPMIPDLLIAYAQTVAHAAFRSARA